MDILISTKLFKHTAVVGFNQPASVAIHDDDVLACTSMARILLSEICETPTKHVTYTFIGSDALQP